MPFYVPSCMEDGRNYNHGSELYRENHRSKQKDALTQVNVSPRGPNELENQSEIAICRSGAFNLVKSDCSVDGSPQR